jgi:excinuclease ABC subunit C
MQKSDKIQNQIQKLPKSPGVYFFKDSDGEILYVGKATSLRDRVRSYWSKELDRGPLIVRMVNLISKIDCEPCDSEMEALILEANYIKHYLPKYNIKLKDDKGYYFVKIACDKGKIADIEVVHKNEMMFDQKGLKYFGPYTSSKSLNTALKFMRLVFPYREEQLAISRNKQRYVGVDREKLFKNNVAHIIAMLEGKKESVIRSLKAEMERLSRQKKYEEAASVRDKFLALQHLKNTAHISEENLEIKTMKNADVPHRIEGYDVSNTSGKEPVVSMVVFIDGKSKKSQYRKFKIKNIDGPNDVAMLMDAVERRLKHTEWELPDIMLIDGGKGQLNAVQMVLVKNCCNIPLVGMAKGPNRKREDLSFINDTGFRNLSLIRSVRDEAHRFAIEFHRSLRSKKLLSPGLTSIKGIGEKTNLKLLNSFASLQRVKDATEDEIALVVGRKIAKKIKQS